MTQRRIAAGCISVLCFCAIVAVPAMAATPSAATGHSVSTDLLDDIQKKGYNTSDIRFALTRGDTAAAENLMQQFQNTHPELFTTSARQAGTTQETTVPSTQVPDQPGQRGYNVSGIRAALTRGDTAAAENLTQQFQNAHPDVMIPAM